MAGTETCWKGAHAAAENGANSPMRGGVSDWAARSHHAGCCNTGVPKCAGTDSMMISGSPAWKTNCAAAEVISDCRFPNEIRAIRQQGGHVIRVVRGADPAWFQEARRHLLEHSDLPSDLPHQSEWAWAGTEFDRVISNDGSLDDLYLQVTDLVQDLRHARVDLAA